MGVHQPFSQCKQKCRSPAYLLQTDPGCWLLWLPGNWGRHQCSQSGQRDTDTAVRHTTSCTFPFRFAYLYNVRKPVRVSFARFSWKHNVKSEGEHLQIYLGRKVGRTTCTNLLETSEKMFWTSKLKRDHVTDHMSFNIHWLNNVGRVNNVLLWWETKPVDVWQQILSWFMPVSIHLKCKKAVINILMLRPRNLHLDAHLHQNAHNRPNHLIGWW